MCEIDNMGSVGMLRVHRMHVYVKVNLITLIAKEHSGLNKLVNRGK